MTASASTLALTGLATFLAAAVASRIALGALRQRALDQPNARSSHSRPVPRGSGIGFVLVIIVVLAIGVATDGAAVPVVVLVGAACVAAISFVDDLRPVPGFIRLVVQTAAVTAVLASMPAGTILADWVPGWLDRLLAGVAWLWFINLFNFMDGIDGIAASEAGVIGVGVAAVAIAVPALDLPMFEAITIAAAALGFLTVNWPPARTFMGDVGSVGLGFLLGWLLIATASGGGLAAALILPLVFLVDATATLAIRAARGRPLGIGHRDHAYQAAVDRGVPHAVVTMAVILVGIVLVGLAAWSPGSPAIALAAALIVAAALVLAMRFGWPPFQARSLPEPASRSR